MRRAGLVVRLYAVSVGCGIVALAAGVFLDRGVARWAAAIGVWAALAATALSDRPSPKARKGEPS